MELPIKKFATRTDKLPGHQATKSSNSGFSNGALFGSKKFRSSAQKSGMIVEGGDGDPGCEKKVW